MRGNNCDTRAWVWVLSSLFISCHLWAQNNPSAEGIVVKNNEKVAVVGDLITNGDESDYPKQVERGLEANGVKINLILFGSAGSSKKILSGLDENVLKLKPDWLILNCGIDNFWGGLTQDQYQHDMTQIVEKAQAAGVKVVLTTVTEADEDPSNRSNEVLGKYNTFLRQLAKDKYCLLADFDMPAAVVAEGAGPGSKRGKVLLVSDYVYLNVWGNQLFALAILKTLGLNAEQLEKAKDSWLDRSDICKTRVSMTLREYQRLDALAAKQNRPTAEFLGEMVAKALKDQAASAALTNPSP